MSTFEYWLYREELSCMTIFCFFEKTKSSHTSNFFFPPNINSFGLVVFYVILLLLWKNIIYIGKGVQGIVGSYRAVMTYVAIQPKPIIHSLWKLPYTKEAIGIKCWIIFNAHKCFWQIVLRNYLHSRGNAEFHSSSKNICLRKSSQFQFTWCYAQAMTFRCVKIIFSLLVQEKYAVSGNFALTVLNHLL